MKKSLNRISLSLLALLFMLVCTSAAVFFLTNSQKQTALAGHEPSFEVVDLTDSLEILDSTDIVTLNVGTSNVPTGIWTSSLPMFSLVASTTGQASYLEVQYQVRHDHVVLEPPATPPFSEWKPISNPAMFTPDYTGQNTFRFRALCTSTHSESDISSEYAVWYDPLVVAILTDIPCVNCDPVCHVCVDACDPDCDDKCDPVTYFNPRYPTADPNVFSPTPTAGIYTNSLEIFFVAQLHYRQDIDVGFGPNPFTLSVQLPSDDIIIISNYGRLPLQRPVPPSTVWTEPEINASLGRDIDGTNTVTARFAARTSGPHIFTITTHTGATASFFYNVTNTCSTTPAFLVDIAARSDGWTQNPATITLELLDQVVSPVSFFYSLSDGIWTQLTSANTTSITADRVVFDIAQANGFISFEARSATNSFSISNHSLLRIDPVLPTLSVTDPDALGLVNPSTGIPTDNAAFAHSVDIAIDLNHGISDGQLRLLRPNTIHWENISFAASQGFINVTQNGAYRFEFLSNLLDGTNTPIVVSSEIVIGRIDNTPNTFTVISTGTTGTMFLLPPHVYTDTEVVFNFSDFDPNLTIQFLKSTDNGVSWETRDEGGTDVQNWQTVPLVSGRWTLDNPSQNGIYIFRAATRAGINANIYNQSGIWFRVAIDRAVPIITHDYKAVSDDWVRGSVDIVISVLYGQSGARITNGVSISSPVQQFTIAEFLSQTDQTRHYRVTITQNGLFHFTATSASGVSDTVSINVDNIEISLPQLSISAIGASRVGQATVWATSHAIFNFTLVGATAPSGLSVIQYQRHTTAGADDFLVWMTLNEHSANFNYVSGSGWQTATNGFYRFRAVSVAGSVGLASVEYSVNIDNTVVSITVTNHHILSSTAPTKGPISLIVEVSFGASGASTTRGVGGLELTRSGQPILGVGIMSVSASLTVFSVEITENGSYQLLAIAGNGMSSPYAFNVTNIESANTNPTFSVIAPNASTTEVHNWTNGTVVFTFLFNTESAISGLGRYQWQRSDTINFDEALPWNDLNTDPRFSGNSFVLSNYTENGFYRFRAISTLGSEGGASQLFRVSIDTVTP
ncbi:MAG: hypothetical protein FWD86_00905, partial [Firmicutes bacterium]|nr:hypothetical protein [Bacillota bacterium]